MAAPEASQDADRAQVSVRDEFALERYRYLLQQIHAVNENLHRFLTIYQTLATSLVAAVLALFVGYREWGVDPATARGGVIGLLVLTTVVAAFTATLIVVGALAWLDYRNEECDLTDEMVAPDFRKRPRTRNLLRWYETYVLAFIVTSVLVMWLLAMLFLLPAMR
ncbi:hypothetical protein [Streptomyces sp. NBC_00878]|uniref:hypothetical protein n=1 Tax=Streptomyces sp. NBC_00878 TaxID=2975854 RepID=UPI002257A1EE|nr:hypothetical protein [Streptomyces sp. NBC_00878]MCX4909221.1 hypothetical protein [Streptomyces sp. NBC_00878]